MRRDMTRVVEGDILRQAGCSEVIVHVQDICQQGLGGCLLNVQFFHLLSLHDSLPRYFSPGWDMRNSQEIHWNRNNSCTNIWVLMTHFGISFTINMSFGMQACVMKDMK